MSPIEVIVIAALVASTVYLLTRELKRRRTDGAITPAPKRILFPFLGQALSTPAFDAALRLARAEGATLVPAYLGHRSAERPTRHTAAKSRPRAPCPCSRRSSSGRRTRECRSTRGSRPAGAFATRSVS